jgi:hypothetical protein
MALPRATAGSGACDSVGAGVLVGAVVRGATAGADVGATVGTAVGGTIVAVEGTTLTGETVDVAGTVAEGTTVGATVAAATAGRAVAVGVPALSATVVVNDNSVLEAGVPPQPTRINIPSVATANRHHRRLDLDTGSSSLPTLYCHSI